METSWLEVTLAPTIMVSTATNSWVRSSLSLKTFGASNPYLFRYAPITIKIIHGEGKLELFRSRLEPFGFGLILAPLPDRLEPGEQSQKASEIHLQLSAFEQMIMTLVTLSTLE